MLYEEIAKLGRKYWQRRYPVYCSIIILCALYCTYVAMDISFVSFLLAREQTEALDSELDVQPHRKSVQFTVHKDAFTLSAVIM